MPQEDGRVFVCYARADQEFVLALASALKARGADLWVDQQDIQAGANWDQAIDDALNRCSCVLVVLSPLAVESREVQGELRTALDEGKTILPVVYKECRLPRVLRSIQHVDVTSGDPTDQAALDRITQALPTAVAPPGGQTTAPAATANAKPHGGLSGRFHQTRRLRLIRHPRAGPLSGRRYAGISASPGRSPSWSWRSSCGRSVR